MVAVKPGGAIRREGLDRPAASRRRASGKTRLPNILVIEDDEEIRSLLVELLHQAGMVGRGARDGQAALAEIQQEPPDLILLDLMMPVLDGHAFLRIRAEQPWRTIPVLVFSAAASCPIPGATATIPKTTDPDRLLDLIWQHAGALEEEPADAREEEPPGAA